MEFKKRLWNRMCHIELQLIALNELLEENKYEWPIVRPFFEWHYKYKINKLFKERDELKSQIKMIYPEMLNDLEEIKRMDDEFRKLLKEMSTEGEQRRKHILKEIYSNDKHQN